MVFDHVSGSADILAAISGILPEIFHRDFMDFDKGYYSQRKFGKMPNPAAKMPALPEESRLSFLIVDWLHTLQYPMPIDPPKYATTDVDLPPEVVLLLKDDLVRSILIAQL